MLTPDVAPRPDWFRVDCDIVDNPKIGAVADALGITLACAIGHTVALFAGVRTHRPLTGDLTGVPAVTLERWAAWDGPRGTFAAAFRDAFCADGILKGWTERQAPLIRKLEYDRDRAALARESKQGTAAPGEPPAGGDGGEPPEPVPPLAFAAQLPPEFRPVLADFVAPMTPAVRRAWDGNLGTLTDGQDGRVHDSAAIGHALRHFLANDKAPNWPLFRGYVRRQSNPLPERDAGGTNGNGNGSAPIDKARRSAETAGAVWDRMHATPEPEPAGSETP